MVHRTLGGVFSVDLTTPELSFGLIFDMLVFYCMARRGAQDHVSRRRIYSLPVMKIITTLSLIYYEILLSAKS